MHRQIVALGICVTSALALCAARPSHAQLSAADASCRREIGKAAKKLADTLLKEKVKCEKLRMMGKIVNTTNCNDTNPVSLPGSVKVAKAEQNLADKAREKCAAASSTEANGYVLCGAPCGSVPINQVYDDGDPNAEAGVADCLKCRIEQLETLDLINISYGMSPNPPTYGSNEFHVKCQGYI